MGLVTRLAAWRASRLKEAFITATADPWRAQQELLSELLARDRSTEYGRRWGFSTIDGPEAFRRKVPLITFEDVAPEVERMARGEPDVLFSSRDKLLRFCVTSGTTGRPKLIPVSRSFLSAYKSGWYTWVWAVVEDYPILFEKLSTHKLLAIVSPPASGTTQGGHPIGAITGLTTSAQARPLESISAAPQACSSIEDFALRSYALVRFALEEEVGHISTPNPSTLIRVASLMAERTDDLIKDVRDGTCRGLDTASEAASALQRRLAPRPDRARELERRAAKEGRLTPKDAWPNLKLISCWTGGTLKLYLERLPEAYGPVALRDLGLIASEGRMSLPLDDSGAGVLDLGSNVYEFIPEAEADSAEPKTLWLKNVEAGQRYFLVLTNRAGLYRYQIQDCVEVVGRFRETPLIVFLNKGRSISSLTGEKLTEHQVLSAAEEALSPARWGITRFTLCPAWAEPPYYVLLLERPKEGEGAETLWMGLVEAFDKALERLNVEYASKRSSGRLGAVELRWLERGAFSRLEAERIAFADGRAEQVKHQYLVPDLDFLARMERPLGLEEARGADS